MKNVVSTAVLLTSLTLAGRLQGEAAGTAAAAAAVRPPIPAAWTMPAPPSDDTESGGPSGELLAKRVVYFDFDSADIRADSQAVVAAHATYLAKNPSQKVRLEGHADERGSREYNIGLGERRGQAVRRALLLQGAAEVQLSTVSYGEERPAVAGSDEQAYALNRRVEIVYLK